MMDKLDCQKERRGFYCPRAVQIQFIFSQGPILVLLGLQQYLAYKWQFIIFSSSDMYKKGTAIKDVLYEEAKFHLSSKTLTPTLNGLLYFQYSDQLKDKITLQQFFMLTVVYFLEKPMMICNYLRFEQQNAHFEWPLFLDVLRTIALYYHGNEAKINALKKVFIAISIVEEIKVLLTVEAVQSLESLGIKKIGKSFFPEYQQQYEGRDSINVLVTEGSRGYAQISIAISLLQIECNQKSLYKIWNKIINIVGKYDLSWVRIFQIVMKSIIEKGLLGTSTFFFDKFKVGMGEAAMVNCLLLKLSSGYFEKGDMLVYRGEIDQVMEEYSCSCPNISEGPQREIILTLALMLKYQCLDYSLIGQKLTPQTQFLLFLQHKRVQLHQSIFKQCYVKNTNPEEREQRHRQQLWGELIFSSKLQLLTDLILINDFHHFKLIAAKQKIVFDYLYHPPLLFAFSELLQWIIDPLYKIIGFAQFFKTPSKPRPQFIDGYFKQCDKINNYFVDSIKEILSITKCYVFARRSTFVKTCRLFREICQKNQRVPVEHSDISTKIVVIISNIIKQYLLPALEFYNRDPTVSYELNSLLECFIFKVEFQIYLECFKQRQLLNMHLAAIFEQTANQQNQCMNRISEGNQKIVAERMRRRMYCHAFSSLVEIFKRITLNCKGFAENISAAVMSTPKLTKKIAFFFIFLQISEKQQSLIRRDSSITLSYTNLIKFAHLLLLKQKDNESYVKILLEYFLYRLKSKKDTTNLSVFQFFHGEVQFLSNLLSEILPVDLSEDCINNYNRIYLTAGPMLKLKLMQKTTVFARDKYIRRNIIKTVFDPNIKRILENKFYFILMSLNDKMRHVASNRNYNISMHGYLHDELLKTFLSLLSLAQFQVSPKQSERYFSIKIFETLVNTYHFPYELVFQMVRKSIATNVLYHSYDIFNPNVWQQLKTDLVTALDLHFRQRTTAMNVFSSLSLNYLQPEQIRAFIELDVFVYFWVMNCEHAFFVNFYSEHITELKQQLRNQSNKNRKEELEQFTRKMMQEQAENRKMFMIQRTAIDINTKIINQYNFTPLSFQLLKPESRSQTKRQFDFFQSFIKYCILPRILISNTEAYYAAIFTLKMFKVNNTDIVNITTIIGQIGKAIISYLPFSTEREASELLPVFWNSLFVNFRGWSNRDKMSEKLVQSKLIQQVLHPDDYDQVLFLLYESQTVVLNNIVTISNEIYCVKNCLYFLFKNQFVPFCKDHVEIVAGYLEEIKSRFHEAEDVILQVKRLSQVLKQRENSLKSMRSSVVRRYEQRQNINVSLQNLSYSRSGNCSSIVKSESRSGNDFFENYPELSTTNEHYSEVSQQEQILNDRQSPEEVNERLERGEGENATSNYLLYIEEGKADCERSQSVSRIYQLR